MRWKIVATFAGSYWKSELSESLEYHRR